MKRIVEQRTHCVRRTRRHAVGIVSAVFGLAAISAAGLVAGVAPAEAKTPGKRYCYKGVCHRVKTIAETRREIGRVRVVSASHYDSCKRDRFNPCGLTSSGERFRPGAADNTASPVYPDGTRLLVWNPRNGKTAVVRVNNAGPYRGRRELDVSRAAAQKLGFYHRGVARLHIKVLSAPTRSEARYRRNRVYKPVPGYVGAFASIDTALLSVSRAITGLFASPVHAVAGRRTPAEARRILALNARARPTAKRRLASAATTAPAKRLPTKVKARSKSKKLRVAALSRSDRKRATRARSKARNKQRPAKLAKRQARSAKSTTRRRRKLPASVVAQSARKKKRKTVKVAALRKKAGKRVRSQSAARKGAGKKPVKAARKSGKTTAVKRRSASAAGTAKKARPVARKSWRTWQHRVRRGTET